KRMIKDDAAVIIGGELIKTDSGTLGAHPRRRHLPSRRLARKRLVDLPPNFGSGEAFEESASHGITVFTSKAYGLTARSAQRYTLGRPSGAKRAGIQRALAARPRRRRHHAPGCRPVDHGDHGRRLRSARAGISVRPAPPAHVASVTNAPYRNTRTEQV